MRTATNPWLVLLALASLGLGVTGAAAQSGGNYNLTWSSLDCGGSTSSAGGNYSMTASIGQPTSGSATGGAYALQGGWVTPTDAVPPDVTDGTMPLVFRLHGNTPNPFATTTAIAFSLPRETDVVLHVYDLAGRRVRSIVEERLRAGKHQVNWDGRDQSGRRAAHGIYMLRLQAGELRAHRKLALVP